MRSPAYAFRRAVPADIPMLLRWRASPEVLRWWDAAEGHDDLLEDLSEEGMVHWIVEYDGRPFAFIQDYACGAEPDDPFNFLPAGSRGIDQYIGEPDMLHIGHGPAFIDAHVRALFAAGAPAVGVDPHPDNLAARRAYDKIGFSGGEVRDTPWGRSLLMTRFADPA